MAKSLRSKRKKRLRTLRREISEPFYEKKESAKLAAQEAALAAPKLPVKASVASDEPAAELAGSMGEFEERRLVHPSRVRSRSTNHHPTRSRYVESLVGGKVPGHLLSLWSLPLVANVDKMPRRGRWGC
ncbi:hypothetical protein B296_00042444 [Ensete ventricosum]|uniref:Uncharacterized protein n=1 Tax=Ensete ventricosum TaxID=4639 RepID=A0A426XKI8_ENSVE|nr:hypothetical protein B296_00042444 [Ensete ventricosum]